MLCQDTHGQNTHLDNKHHHQVRQGHYKLIMSKRDKNISSYFRNITLIFRERKDANNAY